LFGPSIRYEDGSSLYDIVKRANATNTLETGMAYGLSTLFICQAHQERGEGRHVVVDPCQHELFHGVGVANVERAGINSLVTFYESNAHDILPKLLAEGQRFDLVFIDGSHWFEYVMVDFFYADKLIGSGGYVVFHDKFCKPVRKAISYVLRNMSYEAAAEYMRPPSLGWKVSLEAAAKRVYDPSDALAVRLRHVNPGVNLIVLRKLHTDQRTWDYFNPF